MVESDGGHAAEPPGKNSKTKKAHYEYDTQQVCQGTMNESLNL